MAQTFFALDGDTCQPFGFTTGTAARTVTQATPELLDLTAGIVGASDARLLALADSEHFTTDLLEHVQQSQRFDLLVPAPLRASLLARLQALPADQFTRHWAGYATARLAYQLSRGKKTTWPLFVQRFGEAPATCKYNAFLCTGEREEVPALTEEYPKRWHAEEFFNQEQGLGWDRAGTQNINVRYGHMTLALGAQAVLYQLRKRLGDPYRSWDVQHLAKDLLQGLEGDIRVTDQTIVVTFYNAPKAESLRLQYEGLPQKLRQEKVDPRIPWLYDYELDFRFR